MSIKPPNTDCSASLEKGGFLGMQQRYQREHQGKLNLAFGNWKLGIGNWELGIWNEELNLVFKIIDILFAFEFCENHKCCRNPIS
ncbi:hypothetical protein BGP_2381 [Beggiatoa sp. PS]|nr:hypothetical protein BGP_2381 [Beggiatoa sp. PS]